MAVTFDAAGPSSTAAFSSSSTTLSWTHTVGAGVSAANVVLVFVNVDAGSSSGLTCSVTYGGAAMTSLHAPETTTIGAGSGYIQGFQLAGVATGAATVAVTVAGGTPANLIGGSLSFDGYSSLGTAVVANADSTPSIDIPTAGSGNIAAAGFASGSGITAASSPAAGQFLKNLSTVWSTGNLAGATSPGTGSTVTVAWTGGGSSCCLVGVEVQGVTGTNTSPAYATAASDLGGGSGSWVNPGNADGAPDSSYATWTAP